MKMLNILAIIAIVLGIIAGIVAIPDNGIVSGCVMMLSTAPFWGDLILSLVN